MSKKTFDIFLNNFHIFFIFLIVHPLQVAGGGGVEQRDGGGRGGEDGTVPGPHQVLLLHVPGQGHQECNL